MTRWIIATALRPGCPLVSHEGVPATPVSIGSPRQPLTRRLASVRDRPIREHELLLPGVELTALLTLLNEPNLAGSAVCSHRATHTRLRPHWHNLPRTASPAGDKTANGPAWVVRSSGVFAPGCTAYPLT